LPLPLIGAAVVFGARALLRSPTARRLAAKGIVRAAPVVRSSARRAIPRATSALGRVGLRGRQPVMQAVSPIRRLTPPVAKAVGLGAAFAVGDVAMRRTLSGLTGRNGGRTIAQPDWMIPPVPGKQVHPPSTGTPLPAPQKQITQPPTTRRPALPTPPGQVQPLRPDVPLDFAEVTVVKSWQTFPGGPVFTMFSNGKIAVRKKNGVLKVYRPKKMIVVSSNPRIGTLLRADAKLDSLTSRLSKVLRKRTTRSTSSKGRGRSVAKASASSR